jgi:hypothetical protein
MDELHGHRPFADAGRHALHRTVPHVAHGENARNVRLEQEGIPSSAQPLGPLAVPDQIGTGEDEAAFVALDTSPSQSVRGSAPIKMNMELAGTRSILLVSEHRKEISSRCVSPCASETLAFGQT